MRSHMPAARVLRLPRRVTGDAPGVNSSGTFLVVSALAAASTCTLSQSAAG
jgi:hypothetical protein